MFLSPKVKQSGIITNKDGIYLLLKKLQNDLRLSENIKKMKMKKNENMEKKPSKLYRMLA